MLPGGTKLIHKSMLSFHQRFSATSCHLFRNAHDNNPRDQGELIWMHKWRNVWKCFPMMCMSLKSYVIFTNHRTSNLICLIGDYIWTIATIHIMNGHLMKNSLNSMYLYTLPVLICVTQWIACGIHVISYCKCQGYFDGDIVKFIYCIFSLGSKFTKTFQRSNKRSALFQIIA